MTQASDLTTEMVFELAPDAKSAQAGMQLVQKGKFSHLHVSPDRTRLAGRCQGSDPEPYHIAVDFARRSRLGPVLFGGCNCPSYKQPCKHLLGLLLCYIQSPETFAEANVAGPSEGYRLSQSGKEPKEAAKANWDEATELFLGQILATPDDDTPRLIFADWLEEHGDLDRATFIRVQCELAQLAVNDPRGDPLREQEASLWKQHKKVWLAPLPQWLRRMKPEFRRGFVERVTVSANLFLRYGKEMLGAAPIRSVKITQIGGRAPLLAACPQLAQLAELDFTEQQIASQTLAVLLNTPFLKELRSLILDFNPLGIAGARVLTSVPFLTGLKRLGLLGTALGPAAARLIAEWPPLRQLEWLNLGYNLLGIAGARALAASTQASPDLTLMLFMPIGNRFAPAAQRTLRERFGDRVHFY